MGHAVAAEAGGLAGKNGILGVCVVHGPLDGSEMAFQAVVIAVWLAHLDLLAEGPHVVLVDADDSGDLGLDCAE
jgi:hypothetical protein